MNKIKSKISIVCLVLIQVFLLAACGPGEAENPTVTPRPLQTNTPAYQPLIDELAPVLEGLGVPEAATFKPVTGEGIYPLVIIMDRDGESYDKWNEDLPTEWVPLSLEDVELVAYVHEYESSRYCGSASYMDGSTLTGVCVDTNIQVREAQTGKLVKQWEFKSAPPIFPELKVDNPNYQEVKSIPVGFADFWEWFIGDEGIYCMAPFCFVVGQEEWIDDLAFSPDGQSLAVGMAKSQHFSGNKVRLWQVSDGEQLSTLQGPNSENIIFSPDGLMLASGYSYEVTIYQVEDGQLLLSLKGHKDTVRSLAFSPDGQILAAGAGGMGKEWSKEEGKWITYNIRLWRVSDGEQLHALADHEESVDCLAFSPDGKLLASGGGLSSMNKVDNNVRLWRVADGELLHNLEGHTQGVNSIMFSPDGQTLASGGQDDAIRLWRVEDGELLHTLRLQVTEDSNWLAALAFSADGQSLLGIDFIGNFYQWRVEDGTLLNIHEGLTGHPVYQGYRVIFSPDGRTLVSSDRKSFRFYSLDVYSNGTTLTS